MATTKRFRYRLYPTPSASEAMSRIVGCCRAVYNILLAESKEAYFKYVNEGGPRPEISGFSLTLRIKDLKLDDRYLWLQEVSRNPLAKAAHVIEQHALAYLEVKNQDLHWTEEGCIRSISDREAMEMKVLAQTFRL